MRNWEAVEMELQYSALNTKCDLKGVQTEKLEVFEEDKHPQCSLVNSTPTVDSRFSSRRTLPYTILHLPICSPSSTVLLSPSKPLPHPPCNRPPIVTSSNPSSPIFSSHHTQYPLKAAAVSQTYSPVAPQSTLGPRQQ